MTRLLTLCSLALTACGGLTPLGTFTDTDTLDTDPIDVDTNDIDPGTDPVVTGGSPPNLVTLDAADLGSQLSVAFTATDPDGDLVGGTFELTVNGATSAYDVPGSLDTWDVSTGSGTVRITTPSTGGGGGCAGGTTSVSISGIIEDAAGERSGRKSTTIGINSGSSGLPTSEVGDALTSVYSAGTIQVPCTLAGNMDGTGPQGDLDIIEFSVAASATSAQLTWSTTGDYDLYLYDSFGFLLLDLFDGDTLLAPPLASGENAGNTPEFLSVGMMPGEIYYAIVSGYDGPAGDYSVVIQ